MELSERKIQDFIQGKLSLQDSREVIGLLDQHPEWVESYFNEIEWINIRETEVKRLGDIKMNESLQKIRSTIHVVPENKRSKLYYMLTAASVAAAVLLLFLGSWWLRYDGTQPVNSDVTKSSSNTIFYENFSDSLQYIALADGSSIKLNPKSTVSYLKEFSPTRRVVQLTGTAFFSVAKDAGRPFEVQAAGFSTIALGTSFTVNASMLNGMINVQLFTGKVLIKQTVNTGSFKNVLLLPGQQTIINTSNLLATVSNIEVDEIQQPIVKVEKSTELQWDNYITETGIEFNNAALADVFRVLEYHYHITVQYNPAAIKGMQFTGTFKKTGTAQNALATVAAVNKLTLLKSGKADFKIAP